MTSNVKILYKEVICNGDRSLFSYLKDFLALMLQNPVEKSGVMMLFKINRIIFLQIHSSQFIVLANNRLWFLGGTLHFILSKICFVKIKRKYPEYILRDVLLREIIIASI